MLYQSIVRGFQRCIETVVLAAVLGTRQNREVRRSRERRTGQKRRIGIAGVSGFACFLNLQKFVTVETDGILKNDRAVSRQSKRDRDRMVSDVS
jgi:hypothetical protein